MNFNSTQSAENKLERARSGKKKARREMNLGCVSCPLSAAAGCDTGHAERPATDRTAARAREKRENKK
jgi:hypothetical protein